MRAAVRALAHQEEGQMVVEMAVLVPVMVVTAIVVLNLMWFLEASARFDRVAPDMVVAHAVSPAGEDGAGTQEHAVADALQQAMAGMRGVTVTVVAHTVRDDAASGAGFTMAPHLVRYECVMYYEPWPSAFSVAGVSAGTPARLEHRKSLVVDRYRSGVVF